MEYKFMELSEIQKGIYFECQAGGKNIYNIPAAMQIEAALNLSQLDRALMLLMEEQPVLRSSVKTENNKLVLAIEDKISIHAYVYDVGSAINIEAETKSIINQEITYEFNLSSAPLLRVSVVKQAPEIFVLLVNIHHLIADGISLDILLSKLITYYTELINGEEITVTPDYSFFEFLDQEKDKLAKGVYEPQKKYWSNRVQGAKPLDFPKDFSSINNFGSGKEKNFSISKELMDKIETTAWQVEGTPFLVSLSALSLLMSKCCNEDQVTISTPFTYRPGSTFDQSVGCFIYTLPFTNNFGGDLTFRDIVNETYEQFIGAHQNLGYPNNLIARDNFPGAYAGIQTIFDISFVYDKFTHLTGKGIKCRPYQMDDTTFPGNIMITFSRMPDDNFVKIQYKADIYDQEMIELLGQRFIKTLEIVTADPDISIKEIDLFLEQEKEKILIDFNQSSFFDYVPSHVIDLFHKKVHLYPDRKALVYHEGALTYDQLNRKANQLARKILENKTRQNEVVGIQLKRSKEMVVAILAVLKAGCAYVPIESYYPENRKKYIMDDADISICLTVSDMDVTFCENGMVFYLDHDQDWSYCDDSNPTIELNPYDLAYIEYTSGSTGEPKGVMIEHHSVVNTILDLERRFPVESGDVYLYKTPFSFDISGTELYGWFAGQGTLCIMEPDGEKNPELILQYINQYQITHINFVPTMFRLFLELFLNKENALKVKSLKWIFVGGEAITPDTIKLYFQTGISARLENVYGPTECTMWASNYSITTCEEAANVSIGSPLNEIRWYVTDKNNRLQMIGVPGELCLSGVGLARGYLNKPELTNQQFCDNPFYDNAIDPAWYQKMYKTGDLVRWLPNGTIEFLGRIDSQVKINGLRIELGEIENALSQHPDIIKAVVVMKQTADHLQVLRAYYLAEQEINQNSLRKFLNSHIPAYMIPSSFTRLDEIPVNNSGKTDRKSLIAVNHRCKENGSVNHLPESPLENIIAAVWKEVLGIEKIDVSDNFFEIGGHSTLAILAHNKLKRYIDSDFSITALYEFPTIKMLAEFLAGNQETTMENRKLFSNQGKSFQPCDIAIIGMSVNVPGAETLDDFWTVLQEGKESIHFYSDDELLALGIKKAVIEDKHYVKAKGRIQSIDYFDSALFEHTPNEVRLMSPQLRALYKGTWQALEDAGYCPESTEDKIGVFVGGSDDFVWYADALGNGDGGYSETYESYTMSTNHFLATRLAYKFNLKGPALSALTGCSTSLVTPHLACQSLIMRECDLAIAGGITIESPNEGGYMYYDGMMFSPDGHCRPFDAGAQGTVFSNGMGIVVLRRLEEAIASGDHIYGVIKGSAINNDGSIKAGFAAPSVEGQSQAIIQAYQRAGIDPETVSYIEAHGTGTILGDPIEVMSLTKAFGTDKKNYCTLGSVKGNIGHADTAAGIVGLVKVALSLKHKYIPGTVNYHNPNPRIDFSQTPFVVTNKGQNWISQDQIPLRAGINSFGVGGTNAHMIVEEFKEQRESSPSDDQNLILVSGKTESALTENLRVVLSNLAASGNINYSDAAWTMMTGRKHLPYRKAVVVDSEFLDACNIDQAIADVLSDPAQIARDIKHVCFMFSGQGSQYQGMGRQLYYGTDIVLGQRYRMYADKILDYLSKEERAEYVEVIFGDTQPERINETKYSQFALFLSEYAISKTLIDLGVCPDMVIGHSIGEVTAATVAGVWSLQNAVEIVKMRGSIMQKQQPGAMLAVMLNARQVVPLLPGDVTLSLDNTSDRCVVGGSADAIERFRSLLADRNIKSTIVKTSHAFHTGMMAAAAEEFQHFISQFPMQNPSIPIVSNVTGQWVREDEMTNPQYWGRHIVETVQFSNDLAEVLSKEDTAFIEVGAGRSLCTFAVQHQDKKESQIFINMLRHPRELEHDIYYLYKKIGQLWSCGLSIHWNQFWSGKIRKKVSMPTYQFDKTHYPIRLTNSTPIDNRSGCESDAYAAATAMPQLQMPDPACYNENPITEAFTAVLGFGDIHEDEDFFSLGGDSLKAVSLANYIEKRKGIRVAVSEIFKYPTPRKLAGHLKTFQLSDSPSDTYAKITPLPSQPYYSSSYSQQRMFSLSKMEAESTAYNMPSATIIDGLLDPVKVRKAVDQLVKRHEALRTSFKIVDNQVVQVISEIASMEVDFQERELTDEKQITDLITEFVRPFNLSEAPLCRLRLVKIGEQKTVFLFDIHHSVADGTSAEILTRDFNHLYSSIPLEPLKIQYKDFTAWQIKRMQGNEISGQKDYWLAQFNNDIPVLDLPLDKPRPKLRSFDGHRLYFSIDEELSVQTEAFARQHGVTNYMLLLSVWYLILARYSGQEDIVIGTPVAGRSNAEVTDVIGFFLNTLAMRNHPVFEKQYLDFLYEVKENTLNALSNQEYPFDDLLDQLKVKRVPNRNPIFDVYFDYQNMDTHDIDIEGMSIRPFSFDTFSSVYDLVLTCHEYKDRDMITGTLDFAASLFKRDTIERMVENFKVALKSVITHPLEQIGAIDIVSKEEISRITSQFEETKSDIRNTVTIHQSFEEQVVEEPDKTALIVADGTAFSYREINRRSNVIAHQLIESGVGQGDLVGIMTRRNVHLFTSIMGVLKSGAAYVPLDASYPKQRINYMIKQSKPKVILVDDHIPAEYDYNGQFIVCSGLAETAANTLNPLVTMESSALAMVIFTSGSTGNPKGVMLTHHSLINFVDDHIARQMCTPGRDRILSVTTFSFDIFLFESIFPLCAGYSVYLADEIEQIDAAAVTTKILKYNVSHLASTPSRVKAFAENPAFAPALKQLKYIICGGEVYPEQLMQQLQKKVGPDTSILTVYGPTETTIWMTIKDLTHETVITIGKPISNVQVFILNSFNKLQPYGVYGEICIAGKGLSRGYYHNPEETNKRFITLESPLNTKVYKTGDRGRMLPDGEFDILGRFDNQVKIRGYRVELGEIDKTAAKYPDISEAVAKVFVDQAGSNGIQLYYCTNALNTDSGYENNLKKWLESQLPAYMIPSKYIRLEQMPHTPNGKIDKNALSIPESNNTLNISDQEKVPLFVNRTKTQIVSSLVNIWKNVLGKEQINITDNFFDIGGTSLGIMLVNNRIIEELNITIPVMRLFECPTIESLAEEMSKEQQIAASSNQADDLLDDFADEKGDFEPDSTLYQPFTDTDYGEADVNDIAVIGMTCRFPGAKSVEQYWDNLIAGKESIRVFTDDELRKSGISEEIFNRENYVRAKGYLEDAEYFDPKLFDYSDKEASLMDPQIRLLHLCIYELLEKSGYNSFDFKERISLFAGSSPNLLWMSQFLKNQNNFMEALEAITFNEKDFLATRIAYKLNLKGPSMTVQTACSTSLVAIHQAAKSIIDGDAEMAIAAGVSITHPRKEGYLWHQDMILSKDGHCRPFSNDTTGTVTGNGCGAVLLKPLAQALKDRDHIYAVIKGSAVNNDGMDKVGYTAPGIKGQRDVIHKALANANVSAEDICYVEAHGTGTLLGDPIEVEALRQAYNTPQKGYCALGSVKANIGHLDAAAGIAGFIKAVMVLHHKTIPPQINYTAANDKLDLDNSPFYINTDARELVPNKKKRKAGVSSFGIGGTNAHIILEEVNKEF